jgi:hypothetical protein
MREGRLEQDLAGAHGAAPHARQQRLFVLGRGVRDDLARDHPRHLTRDHGAA